MSDIKPCQHCNSIPVIVDNMLHHKCKKLSLLITDSDTVEIIIKKWNKIQEQGNFKNVLVDA